MFLKLKIIDVDYHCQVISSCISAVTINIISDRIILGERSNNCLYGTFI